MVHISVNMNKDLEQRFERLKMHSKSDIKKEANFQDFVSEAVMLELNMIEEISD